VKAGPVALRYATALFELARERGALDAVAADVERVARVAGDPERGAWLVDARVPAAAKRERIERLAADLHPLSANFLRLLSDKRRLEVLGELRAAFRRCLLAERNSAEGVVESPRPLSAEQMGELSKSLTGLLGKRVELEARVRPELLAGVRVIVDNKLIDQSAAGRLEGLAARLRRARIA
jgi:F-type H+-transporting ATPase subunit delta